MAIKQTKSYRKSRQTGIKLRQHTHRRVRLAFIPHAGNQYRPHLIRPFGLIAVIMIAFSIPAMTNQLSTGSVLGATNSVTPEGLYTDTNSIRSQHGVQQLRANRELSQAASDKAHDMLQYGYWAHVSPTGVTPWHWFQVAGYNYSAAGENLAKNFSTNSGLMTAWMASPEHRANILDARYSDIGLAVVNGQMNGQPIELVVALYGEPVSAAAAVSSTNTQLGQGVSTVLAARDSPLSLWQRIGVAINSLNPSIIISLVILLGVGIVAAGAQLYRHKLPERQRIIWYAHHHGLLKVGGMVSLSMVVLLLYSGGQI